MMKNHRFTPGANSTCKWRTSIANNQAQAVLYDGYRPIQPEHIARIVNDVIALPGYVDVARVEVFPTDQATGGGTMVKFDAQ